MAVSVDGDRRNLQRASVFRWSSGHCILFDVEEPVQSVPETSAASDILPPEPYQHIALHGS